jgi:hypothetical protein
LAPVITLLPFLLACGSESEFKNHEETVEVPSNVAQVDLPRLKVESPERGSFDTSGAGKIAGQVGPGTAPISVVKINGQEVPTEPDGSFSQEYDWSPGIQIIGVRVEDEDGERAVDGRAIQAGPVYGPGQWVTGALRIEIDTDILDDDDPEIDDIAALLEAALEDPSMLDLVVGHEIEVSGFSFIPTHMDFAWADVDLVPGDGILQAEVVLNEVDIEFDIEGSGIFSWVSTTATARADQAEVGAEVAVITTGGNIHTQPTWVEADLVGFEVTLDWFPDGLEDTLADLTEGLVEDAVVGLASTVIEDTVASGLQAFVVQMELGEDLEMEAALSELEVVRDAVRFVIDTRIEALTTMPIPSNAGSLKRYGEPPAWPLSESARLAVAVDDDFINQLAFAFWHTGLLKDVSLPGIAVGGMAGSALPPPLGPADNVLLSLDLPPIASPPRDVSFDADISIGEWRMRFERTDGEVLDFSVSLRTALNATIEDASSLEVELDNRPAHIDLEIGVIESPDGLDPGDLAALVRLMIPPLVGNSAELVPVIPIPTIPMGELIDIPAADGLVVGMTDPEMTFTEAGWLVLQADVDVVR